MRLFPIYYFLLYRGVKRYQMGNEKYHYNGENHPHCHGQCPVILCPRTHVGGNKFHPLQETIGYPCQQRHFDHPSLFEPGEGDRDDNITRVRVLLRRALPERLFVTAGWRYTHWSSNVGAYDFDRAVSDIRFTYRY